MDVDPRDPEVILREDGFVRGLAKSLLFDRDRAEDVAQKAWLAACQSAAPRRGLRQWFSGVVKRLSFRELRDDSRQRAREGRRATPGVAPSAAEIHERESIRREVVEAVLALEEPYQATLLLRFFEDLPPRDIARRMRVPVETVRTRLKRGLERVRRRLDLGTETRRSSIGVCLLGLAGLSSRGVGLTTGIAGSWMEGVIAMKSGAKLGAAAVVLGLSGVLVWTLWNRTDRVGDGELQPETRPGMSESQEDLSATPLKTPEILKPELSPVPIETSAYSAGSEAKRTSSEFGSLLLQVVWARNGEPAPRQLVKVLVWNQRDPFLNERLERTDDEGKIRFDRVPAGHLTVSPLLGGQERVKVEAGRENAAKIQIPKGGRIEGTVTESDGSPVEGADIWFNNMNGGTEGTFVTRSAASGFFRIDDADVSTWRFVGARKSGKEPTPLVSCSGAVDSVHQVSLVFSSLGGSVAGVVMNAERKPIPGAKLLIGPKGGDQGRVAGGAHGATPGPEALTADRDGRFKTSGLAEGRVPILARAGGYALYRNEVEVRANSVKEVEIILGPGGVLEGKVLNKEGKPLERAAVEVNGYGDLDSSFTRSTADGSFIVHGLEPGEAKIKVETKDHGQWNGKVTMIEGQTTAIEIRLEEGMKILGRLVDEHGAVLENYWVAAEYWEKGTSSFGSATSDKEGRFVIKNVLDAPHNLRVMKTGGGSQDLKSISKVRPGQPELTIVIEGALRTPGSITGRVVDENFKPLGTAQISTGRKGSNNAPIEHVDGTTGIFKIEKLPPDTYGVRVSCPGFAGKSIPNVEITEGENKDLGDIQLGRGGSIELTLDVEGQVDLSKAYACIRPLTGGTGREGLVITKNVARSEGIVAGPAEVDVGGEGIAYAEITVEIVDGQVTKVKLPIRPGAKRVFQLRDPEGVPPETANWIVRDSQGAEVLTGRSMRWEGQLTKIQFNLPVGSYAMQVTASTGQVVTRPVVISGLTDDPTPHEIGF